MKKNFKGLVKNSVQINNNFKRRWDIKTRTVNLSEEVGELAHAILVNEKDKVDGTKPTIAENLTNLLYELFLIANHYKVDLDKAWEEFIKVMPSWAEKRNK